MVRTLIYPEWLIDGTGTGAQEGQALVFDDEGRIEAVDHASQIRARDTDVVVTAAGQTLLPALINMHVHLCLASDNAPLLPYMASHSDVALAMRAAHNAATSPRAGVTTVRDCGSRGRTVLDLREAITERLLPGSRIVAAGAPVTISGGHMRFFGGEVDGLDGIRQVVRRLVSDGADFIKVAGSGGDTPGSLSEYPSFSVEELKAVAEVAHGLGKRVTVHCTATEAISRAVEAGVDSLEHGFFSSPTTFDAYDEALADRLAEARISVTPTLQVIRDTGDYVKPGAERDLWQRQRDAILDHVSRLWRAGVRLTAGSDAGWRVTRFDTFWRELEELNSCGLSPIEAIHAATGAASEVIGRQDTFGTLRAGSSADLLLVDGNAARDIRSLAAVRTVYQAGRRIVD